MNSIFIGTYAQDLRKNSKFLVNNNLMISGFKFLHLPIFATSRLNLLEDSIVDTEDAGPTERVCLKTRFHVDLFMNGPSEYQLLKPCAW